MKIKFVGAVENVTGSCTLLHYPRTGIEFLVDCGQVQGEPNALALNARPWPFVPKNLSFVLLTHAHLDHCGLIPRLYKDGFKGKVICTRFTGELVILNLEDAIKHEGVPFDIDDVRSVRFEYLDDRDGFGFSKRLPIANDLFVSLLRSAHIGGACSITISWMTKREEWSEIHFSGDVGNNRKDNCYQSILASRQTPLGFPRHIVLESTYGDRTRDSDFANYEKRIEALSIVVTESLRERSGPIIIPCFSIHRTQEILVDLHVVLEYLKAQEAVCSEGRPLLRSPETIDIIVRDGLQARHIEGKKSLISHWSPEQQKEWLSWFVRVSGGTDGDSEPIRRTSR